MPQIAWLLFTEEKSFPRGPYFRFSALQIIVKKDVFVRPKNKFADQKESDLNLSLTL